MRTHYSFLKALFHKVPFEKIGNNVRPAGIRIKLALKQLPALLVHNEIGTIVILGIEGIDRIEPVMENWFWGIKARFVIQIEGETDGVQTFEDRILLVKAADEQEAQQKLLPSFEQYAEPYLNGVGQLVRWNFEEFIDAYSTDVSSLKEFLTDAGVEVFSELRRRKFRAGSEWKSGLENLG